MRHPRETIHRACPDGRREQRKAKNERLVILWVAIVVPKRFIANCSRKSPCTHCCVHVRRQAWRVGGKHLFTLQVFSRMSRTAYRSQDSLFTRATLASSRCGLILRSPFAKCSTS